MKRILKVVLGMLCGLLAILLALLIALWLYTNGANMRRPQIAAEDRPQWALQRSDTLRVMGPNSLSMAAKRAGIKSDSRTSSPAGAKCCPKLRPFHR